MKVVLKCCRPINFILFPQVHWNNPDFRTDFVDSSGLSLFYTAEKRDNDAGMSIIGQSVISIPPQQQLYTVTGDCPQRCTAELPHDIHIASALLHMHYLGEKYLL